MMRRSLRNKLIGSGVFALAAVTVVVATSVPLRAAGPTAVGLWEQVDENSGKAESWIKISERTAFTREISSRSSPNPARTRTGSAVNRGL